MEKADIYTTIIATAIFLFPIIFLMILCLCTRRKQEESGDNENLASTSTSPKTRRRPQHPYPDRHPYRGGARPIVVNPAQIADSIVLPKPETRRREDYSHVRSSGYGRRRNNADQTIEMAVPCEAYGQQSSRLENEEGTKTISRNVHASIDEGSPRPLSQDMKVLGKELQTLGEELNKFGQQLEESDVALECSDNGIINSSEEMEPLEFELGESGELNEFSYLGRESSDQQVEPRSSEMKPSAQELETSVDESGMMYKKCETSGGEAADKERGDMYENSNSGGEAADKELTGDCSDELKMDPDQQIHLMSGDFEHTTQESRDMDISCELPVSVYLATMFSSQGRTNAKFTW